MKTLWIKQQVGSILFHLNKGLAGNVVPEVDQLIAVCRHPYPHPPTVLHPTTRHRGTMPARLARSWGPAPAERCQGVTHTPGQICRGLTKEYQHVCSNHGICVRNLCRTWKIQGMRNIEGEPCHMQCTWAVIIEHTPHPYQSIEPIIPRTM